MVNRDKWHKGKSDMPARWKLAQMTEVPKAHDMIPDSLGYTDLGYLEQRDGDGQLYIYFQKDPSLYVVLGKYAQARSDGTEYYVSDYSSPLWEINLSRGHRVNKFEHLLQAAAFIAEVHEQHLARTHNPEFYTGKDDV